MKILFFSPFADINLHYFVELFVAKKLANQGHKIYFVTCNGIFRRICNCMYARNLNESNSIYEKEKICDSCKIKKTTALNKFGFEEVAIEDFIEEKTINQFKINLHSKKIKKIKSYFYKNVDIGNYAAYEFFLTYKKNDYSLNETESRNYKSHMINCFIATQACSSIYDEKKPEAVFIFDSNYSVNRCAYEAAKIRKIPIYTLTTGTNKKSRYHTFFLEKNVYSKPVPLSANLSRSPSWKEFKKQKASNDVLRSGKEEFDQLQQGKDFWVYSLGELESNNIDPIKQKKMLGKKVVTFLCSSNDERKAGKFVGINPKIKNSLFKSEQKLIKELIKKTKQNKHVFLIIRVHPREFPNKREQVLSSNAKSILRNMKNIPKNVWINTPKDGIGISKIIEKTDLAVTASSSSGLEFLHEKKPVLAIQRNNFFAYPPEFNAYPKNKRDFYRKVFLDNKNSTQITKSVIYKWIFFRSFKFAFWLPFDLSSQRNTLLARFSGSLIKKIVPLPSMHDVIKFFYIIRKLNKASKNGFKILGSEKILD